MVVIVAATMWLRLAVMQAGEACALEAQPTHGGLVDVIAAAATGFKGGRTDAGAAFGSSNAPGGALTMLPGRHDVLGSQVRARTEQVFLCW
jgi:hypothetical protein